MLYIVEMLLHVDFNLSWAGVVNPLGVQNSDMILFKVALGKPEKCPLNIFTFYS